MKAVSSLGCGTSEGAFAQIGNNDSAIADTSYSSNDTHTFAGEGDGNFAYVDGPDNSTAAAGSGFGGSDNVAHVDDPFGMAGTPDTAAAGDGSKDLAEVLFTHGDANAAGSLMYDIISLFGNQAGSF